jgi:hypothetical protein
LAPLLDRQMTEEGLRGEATKSGGEQLADSFRFARSITRPEAERLTERHQAVCRRRAVAEKPRPR